jgi:hypothetical protein
MINTEAKSSRFLSLFGSKGLKSLRDRVLRGAYRLINHMKWEVFVAFQTTMVAWDGSG